LTEDIDKLSINGINEETYEKTSQDSKGAKKKNKKKPA